VPNAIVRDERTYRRGLVMGLTLAEIMLLVLFALLLIFGWIIQNGEMNSTIVKIVKPLLPASVLDGTASENQITDAVSELTTAAALGRQILKGLGPSSATKSQKSDPTATVKRALEQLQLGRDAEAALGTNSTGMGGAEAAHEALGVAKAEFAKARRERGYGSARIWLSGLVKNQQGDTKGNGLVFPSCVPEENGKPPYVYDVTLRSDGLTARDNALPDMAKWASETAVIQFDIDVSPSTFEAMTTPLFEWSRRNQCRFFVRVFDATLPDQKAIYKNRLQTVEDHFYKFLSRETAP
jgi:hypothetical protein